MRGQWKDRLKLLLLPLQTAALAGRAEEGEGELTHVGRTARVQHEG